jgi:hypothetical protein
MTLGKTRWRRFSVIFGSSMALVVGVLALMATGALALPVTISGTVFQVSASSLTSHTPSSGPAFIQYGAVDVTGGAPTAVAVTVLPAGGVLPNLNQVVCGPTGLAGPFANLKVTLTATSADATGGLVVDATSLDGGLATFNNIQIGVPVLSDRGQAPAYTFGQTADSVSITGGISQNAVYTQAGTFALTGLHLSAAFASSC